MGTWRFLPAERLLHAAVLAKSHVPGAVCGRERQSTKLKMVYDGRFGGIDMKSQSA